MPVRLHAAESAQPAGRCPLLQALTVSVLSTLLLPGARSQNQTSLAGGDMHFCTKAAFLHAVLAAYADHICKSRRAFPSVQGLLSFKGKTYDPQGVLASWNASTTPCSTADCSSDSNAQDCNWAGVACQNGVVVALAVPCTVQSNGSTGACALNGAPLDSLVQVRSLMQHCFAPGHGRNLVKPVKAVMSREMPLPQAC